MLIAVVGLSTASCRSCGCVEGEKTYEHIDKPIKVELVRSTHWASGRIPGPMSDFSIRVHATTPFDEPTYCTKVNLAENETGTLVAFRCVDPQRTPWTLIRLGKSGRHFLECAPPLDGDEPDFGDVPPLAQAASKIVGCFESPASQTYGDVFKNLADELRETNGDQAVVRFMIEAAGSDGTTNGDPWTTQLAELKPSDRALVLKGVCPALLDASTTSMRWIHAAAECPLDDPAIGNVALERVRASFKDEPGDVSTLAYWDPSFAHAVLIAMRAHASEVATAGCAYLAQARSDIRALFAEAAIAYTKATCPNVGKLYGLCDESLDCDGGLCTAETLRPEIERWAMQTMADGGRTFASPSDSHRVLLAATYAQGPLPAEVALSNARRHYAIDLGTGTACFERGDAGVTCACSNAPSDYELCTMAVDGGRFTSQSCSFLVDDKKKTIGDPRHACGNAGDQCISDQDCCIQTTCKQPDGGIGPSHCAL